MFTVLTFRIEINQPKVFEELSIKKGNINMAISLGRAERLGSGMDSEERPKVIKFTSGDDLEDDFMLEDASKSKKDGASTTKGRTVMRKQRRKKIQKLDGSETEVLYSVSDPSLISNGSETKYNNSISDPLLIHASIPLISNGSETEYNHSVSIRLDSCIYSSKIRDRIATEYLNSVAIPSQFRFV
ncbi:hypothetical protein Syun_018927 [Stephania yunnanensis]|uniref:Uncharacterized protein n=1 Tax=Stephania yunnanensis TaxID=152371 RepID=A0AAP0ITT9_9MAGN